MKELEQEPFSQKFYDNWYGHYYKIETCLQQNNPQSEIGLGNMDEELVKWLVRQKAISNMLPAELRNKLAALNYNIAAEEDLWEAMYDQLSAFFQKHGHSVLPAEPQFEILQDWLIKQTQDKKYITESQVQKLDSLCVDWDMAISRDQRWERMYFKLKDFKNIYGHCLVPQKWEQDKTLANWVCVQRRLYATQKIRKDRVRKLNEINFVWNIQVIYESQWQHHYEQLVAFYKEHGHCRVPGKYQQLTSWIENQRTHKKNNQLSAERQKKLDKINFIWNFRDIKENYWHDMYQQLRAFKKNHGHSFVPVNYKENKPLGQWVALQRRLEATDKLEAKKKQQLNRLGFVWKTDTQRQMQLIYDSQWQNNFEKLKTYQQKHGTCQVSLKIDPALQRWTRWQRILFYEGRLSGDRINKLNDLRFPWSVQEGYWMKMYEALVNFRKKFKHTRVPCQWPNNPQLADWVYRMKVNKPELSVQKVELLNSIGFDWTLIRKTVVSWDLMYKRLVDFKQEYGHTRVPVKWKKDPKLGKWISRMRQERENLLPERLGLLENIGFDWGYRFALEKVYR